MFRRATKVAAGARLAAAAAIAISTTSCATPSRTTPLADDRPQHYQWPGDGNSDPESLVILTASGGGQRAAALSLGALLALDQIGVGGGTRTMLDEVDVVSSVSGGSVTAAYFALHGRDGLDTLERSFIRRGGNGALIGYGLDPANLVRLAGPGYTRLDWVVDYLEDALFEDSRYADLIGRRPYLIVNAADMGAGTTFSFTQPWFDLLCADLTDFPLADAVAASAAVPVAFAPLTLRNNAPCAEQGLGDLSTDSSVSLPTWARWIGDGLAFERHGDIERLRRARTALDYLNLDCDENGHCTPVADEARKDWLHLLDGGIVDNLGLTEPLRLISTQEVAPFFLPEIVSGRIARIAFIVVSARVDNDLGIDRSGETPGLLTMLRAAISSPINAASLGLVAQLNDLINRGAETYRSELARYGRVVYKDGALRNPLVPTDGAPVDRFALLIDFELIEDPRCRAAFQSIGTNWTLSPREAGALIHIAGPLLAANPAFGEFVDAMGGRIPYFERIEDSCNRLIN